MATLTHYPGTPIPPLSIGDTILCPDGIDRAQWLPFEGTTATSHISKLTEPRLLTFTYTGSLGGWIESLRSFTIVSLIYNNIPYSSTPTPNSTPTPINASATEAPSSHPTPSGPSPMQLFILAAYYTTTSPTGTTTYKEVPGGDPTIVQSAGKSEQQLLKELSAQIARDNPTLDMSTVTCTCTALGITKTL